MTAITRVVLAAVLFAGSVSAHAAEQWLTVPDPAPLPPADEDGAAPVNDIRMHYQVWNRDGPDPVILLHGGLGNTTNWGNQVPALMEKHRVIAVDSRGHGKSTRSDQPFGYHLMASDVIALMDQLGIDKASIVGWSDGGIIGLDIAMNWPDRLNKLFAYGANYNLSGIDPSVETNPVFGEAIGKAAAQYAQLSPTPDQWEEFLGAVMAMWSTQPDFKPEELATITAPTVIADGEYEEAIRPEHTAELARLIPGAQLVIIPKVSHMGLWQDPAAFNQAMTSFLDGG
jgi:pimeloyl-ACP methyl ester carboxylesterase